SVHYFYSGVTERSEGQPAFVAVGEVDGKAVFVRYDSETRRAQPRVPWVLGAVDPQYWDRSTQIFQSSQQVFHDGLDTL
ncbi:HA1B protein, partial [Crypturellus undulatus]|nr:HA1B protein [Crypturellus undulatus]